MLVVTVTSETFDSEVVRSLLPVLVLFGAVWSVPSNKIALKMGALDSTKVKVCRVDIDSSADLAMKFSVRDLPLVMLFKQGMALAQDTDLSDSILAAISA